MIKGPRARIQFYSVPRHFKQVKVQWELRQFAGSYFWKLMKCLRYNFMADYDDYEKYGSKQLVIEAVHVLMNEWTERLGGNKLHGGERPDAADFQMYAELLRVETLPLMKGILSKRPKACEFVYWHKLMSRSCAPQNRF